MIKLDIHGVHVTVDESLKKYITKKINKLEKYVPMISRESFHVEVYLEEIKSREGKQCECEVVVYLPKEVIRIREGTMNMYAAVDIVEEKLNRALVRYKEIHSVKLQHHLSRELPTES